MKSSRAFEEHTLYLQKLSVPIAYKVFFTRHMFAHSNACLIEAIRQVEPDRRHRVFPVIDAGVLQASAEIRRQLSTYARHYSRWMELVAVPSIIPGGEEAKNDARWLFTLQRQLYEYKMDRQSVVLIVGGGAVLDMAGYAAATTHRGLRVVRVPTTVLSQADGGLGVKNGVNAFGVKNFLGTFTAPFAIVNDMRFIDTLPARHRISGMAEAVKVSLIRNVEFFEWLSENAAALASFNQSALSHLIRQSAEIHLRHISLSGDPFESGSARPLDFGHWAAHKLESMTSYRLHHGEAVAIGIAIDSRYSVESGLLPDQAFHRIIRLLDQIGLPTWHQALDMNEPNGRLKILEGLDEFKQHVGGNLTVTLLKGIGEGIEIEQVDCALIERSISWLKKRHVHRCGLT